METYLFITQTDPIADVLLTILYLLLIGNIIKMRKQTTRLLEMLIAVNMANVSCNENNNECDSEDDEVAVEEDVAEDDEVAVEEDVAEDDETQ